MSLKYSSADEMKGCVLGTLIYVSTFMTLLAFQSFSKIYLLKTKKADLAKKDGKKSFSFKELSKVKYYNRDDTLALAGDRAVGNAHEQSVLFLPLFWLHALLVDPSLSFSIAVVYSLSRIVYPVLYLKDGFGPFVFLSTVPGYFIMTYLGYKLAAVSIDYLW